MGVIYGFYNYRFQRNIKITNELGKSQLTSAWKAYSYSNYDFSINLPESWKITDATSADTTDYPYLHIESPNSKDYLLIIRPISKEKETFDHILDTQGFIKSDGRMEKLGKYNVLTFTQSLTFKGNDQPTISKSYFLENNKRVFIVFKNITPEITPGDKNTLDRIVSTFQFLE